MHLLVSLPSLKQQQMIISCVIPDVLVLDVFLAIDQMTIAAVGDEREYPVLLDQDERCFHLVRYKLEDDSCVYRDSICSTITANAFCNRDTNRCSCRPSFYQSGEQCGKSNEESIHSSTNLIGHF